MIFDMYDKECLGEKAEAKEYYKNVANIFRL